MAEPVNDAPTYDDGTFYNVKLARPVTYRRSRLLPLHPHEIRGAVLNEIVDAEGEDAIDSAEPVGGAA